MSKLAAGGFAAALLCFLLPFFHISCMGQNVMTVSGLALITGGKAQMSKEMDGMMGGMTKGLGGMMGEDAPPMKGGPAEMDTKVEVEPLAIAAAAAVVLGLALSFLPRKAGAVAGMAASVAAIVLLVVLMYKLDGDLKRDMAKEKGGAAATQPSPTPGMPAEMKGMEEMMAGGLEKSMGGMVELKAAFGFMLAVGLLAVAAALHLFALIQMGKARGAA
ncbi:MAG TPA: hypothetical protein VNE39_05185 [Planctomycetota bacterium]|nr:hypothetical protein [Planctomycetota bacterium]